MNSIWFRALLALGVLLAVVLASMAAANEPPAQGDEGTIEIIEVKRAETKEPRHPSLQFLRDNRTFLRSQLDRLRQTRQTVSNDAQTLDERLLRLQELSNAIAAARDTVGDRDAALAERTILENVTDLGDLVAELALMEQLLVDHRERLLVLEQDFLGRQETSLVILLRGLGGGNAPEAILLGEDDDVVRIELTPEQRASLEQGGVAQLYHEFVEPREHVFQVSFAGASWIDAPPVSVTIETPRDRLTFLELDASRLDRGEIASGLTTSVWYR
ncbi:MAG: hypothetical protein OEX18_08150 [Candidatus Krumholzibacteria bacterium]|nr:hypothetical protein [Candidatus Krumholzibacteria bacterium]MDH4337236.1 hypothetical protein [Candidatus Krumholzibacteria bacterium]MDH5268698.1 hypothetical protein [Candidatus Krumholzibacteria bacterium]